jgi:hypothetical protein
VFKAIIRGVAVAAVAVGAMMAVPSMGSASSAEAAPSISSVSPAAVESAAPATEDATVLAGCPGVLVEPIGDINVRPRPSTGSGHLGVAEEGAQYPCRIRNITGGDYDACEGGDQWVQIEWEGSVGYVAQRCVRFLD